MKKRLELEDASNLDDEKDIIKPNPFWEDEDDDRCQKHKEMSGTCYRVHYGNCVYCILDGENWDEEWDSWGEMCIRAMELFMMGYEDGMRKVFYPCKRQGQLRNQAAFVKIYKAGQRMAFKSTPLCSQDETALGQ